MELDQHPGRLETQDIFSLCFPLLLPPATTPPPPPPGPHWGNANSPLWSPSWPSKAGLVKGVSFFLENCSEAALILVGYVSRTYMLFSGSVCACKGLRHIVKLSPKGAVPFSLWVAACIEAQLYHVLTSIEHNQTSLRLPNYWDRM